MDRSLRIFFTIYCFTWFLINGSSARAEERKVLSATVERKEAGGLYAGWWVVETRNFRVLHAEDKQLARMIAQSAEATRARVGRKWFGKNAANWRLRCEVVVYQDGAHYAQATGISSNLPGYAQVQEESGRIVRRCIDLNGAAPELLTAIVPHEVTHVVLWSEMGRKGLPRWAQEGIAVLSEPRRKVELHLVNLPVHRQAGELFPLRELMGLAGYPERHRFGPFYAQSVSLVEFLTSQRDHETFIQFLRDGRRQGFEKSLRRHYSWTMADLEHYWTRSAFAPADGAQTANRTLADQKSQANRMPKE